MDRSAAHHRETPAREPSRDALVALADRMLVAVRPFASPGGALITLPGAEGGYGRRVDGFEGFARTFLLAGFRIAGARGEGVDELLERYAAGLAAGTDPASEERWVRLDEHGQAKVEAASIALVLDLTRPWLWDRLPTTVQERVVAYLAAAVGDDTYPRINWVWFRLVVETFLRSVGGPWSADDMAEDLATHDSFVRADGWLADGQERAFDHYTGWALHLYPALWARMRGAEDLAAPRRAHDVALLDRYLQDAVALVGGDGSPLLQGRSLIYRFAAAAPFWVGSIAEVPSLGPGLLRRAATRVVGHFAEHGAPDERGLLTLGWHHEWRPLAQSYSGPGSPYWAAKGLLGIALPADHPVWTAPDEPLPVERGDVLRAVRAPGWIVSGTRADGVVRVVNHGTDHAVADADVADSPLYARLGYSTATSPLLDDAAWRDPLDQSVALVDPRGRASHRSGMRVLATRADGDVGVAASVANAHWVQTADDEPDHGSGRGGEATAAGVLTTVSLVRGPWELRLVRVDHPAEAAVSLRVGGWAVSGDGPGESAHDAGSARAAAGGLGSSVAVVPVGALAPAPDPVATGVDLRDDATPLGPTALVPWVRLAVVGGAWHAVLLELGGPHAAGAAAGAPLTARLTPAGDVVVTWPDGAATTTSVPEAASVPHHPSDSTTPSETTPGPR
ncbi:DUF2264 domain-containing protein [Luteimicrobium sp. DT211]|uniref:DUF2264 domain-containing protein n=1 Tax=Luteimicrobium sp. DT211 TaxID=3393412 RepID=UPI003CF8F83B